MRRPSAAVWMTPNPWASERGTRSRRRHAGAARDVLLDHLAGVHPVHVVGAEDDDVLGPLVVHEVQALVDRVGRAAVPLRAERCCAGTGVM
jgi:hypothetical protein